MGSSAAAETARYGDLLFISGQSGITRGTASPSFESQAATALDRLRAALEAHRLTTANVVYLEVFLTNLNDAAAFDAVAQRYFKATPPARSVVQVTRLPDNASIVISAIAGR